MHKRTLLLGSTALLTVTLLGTGLVSATGPNDDHGKAMETHSSTHACVAPRPTPTPIPGTTPTPTPTPRATPTPGATPEAKPKPAKVATFRAQVSRSHPCGTIKVKARVLHPAHHTTFSAWAVAHFSSGDVKIQLKRAGKSFVARGKIHVPAGQAAGPVLVDVTIVYGGVTELAITKTSQVKAH